MAIVYCATNVINRKRYIGASKNSLETRMAQHINNARNALLRGRFYAAIRKYGADCFLWEVLSNAITVDLAFDTEKSLISALCPEYNIREGGRSGYTQVAHNRKQIMCLEDGLTFPSMSEAAAHYKADLSTISKIVRAGHGATNGRHFILHECSLEERERADKIKELDGRAVLKRKRGCKPFAAVRSVDGKDAMGRSAAGPMKNAKPVICLTDNNEFPSASAAASHYGVPKSAVIELCLGKNYRKTVSGMKFAYNQRVKSGISPACSG
jgi:hypothetical protein